jgi:cytochrome c
MARALTAAALAAAMAGCGSEMDAATAPEGAAAFRQCAVCHTVAAPDTPAGKVRLVGPPLFGVYGRPAAAVEGFSYSRALKSSGVVWDDAALDAFLADPQALVPGTLMSYAGESDPARRKAMIDYLKTLK